VAWGTLCRRRMAPLPIPMPQAGFDSGFTLLLPAPKEHITKSDPVFWEPNICPELSRNAHMDLA
jgi:hypothetical protein